MPGWVVWASLPDTFRRLPALPTREGWQASWSSEQDTGPRGPGDRANGCQHAWLFWGLEFM